MKFVFSLSVVSDCFIVSIPFSRYTPQHIPYIDLQSMTNNFNDQPLGENDGRLLGKGAFGSVHLAIQGNQLTAVKRLNKDVVNIERHFRNEVEALIR